MLIFKMYPSLVTENEIQFRCLHPKLWVLGIPPMTVYNLFSVAVEFVCRWCPPAVVHVSETWAL